jgi:hypothetical protein
MEVDSESGSDGSEEDEYSVPVVLVSSKGDAVSIGGGAASSDTNHAPTETHTDTPSTLSRPDPPTPTDTPGNQQEEGECKSKCDKLDWEVSEICKELVHTRQFDVVLTKLILAMPEYSIKRFMYDPVRKKTIYLRPGRVVWEECRLDTLIGEVECAVLNTFRAYCRSVGCDTSRFYTRVELADRKTTKSDPRTPVATSSAAEVLMEGLNEGRVTETTPEPSESDSRRMLAVWNTLMIKGESKCTELFKTLVKRDNKAMHAVCKKRKEGWFLAKSAAPKPDRFVRLEKTSDGPKIVVEEVKETDYAMETIRSHIDADASLLLNGYLSNSPSELPDEHRQIYNDMKLVEEWVLDSWLEDRWDVCRYSIARRTFAECFPEQSSKEKVVHVEVCAADAGKDVISNAFGHAYSPNNPNVLKANELYQGGNFLDVSMVRKMSYNGAVVHNDTDFRKIPDDVIRVRFGNSTDSGERDAYADDPHRRSDELTLFCSCNHHLYRKYADDTQDKIRAIFDLQYNSDGSTARRIRKRFVSKRQEGDDAMIVQIDQVKPEYRDIVPHKPSEIDIHGDWKYASAFSLFTFKVLMEFMIGDIKWTPKRNYPSFCQEQSKWRLDTEPLCEGRSITRITRVVDRSSTTDYLNMGRDDTVTTLVKIVFDATERRKGQFITPSDVLDAVKTIAYPIQWSLLSLGGTGHNSYVMKAIMKEYAKLKGEEWTYNPSPKQSVPGSKKAVKGYYFPGLLIRKLETETTTK